MAKTSATALIYPLPQSAEQSYQRSSEYVHADSLKTISPQSHLSNKVVRTESKDYTLNKEKALSKKLLRCAKDHIKIEMKQNKIQVLELSTSAYELMKQTINDFLNSITNDTQLQLAFDVEKVLDEDGVHVETRYKVVNRKVDGNPGKISKLTINCYHTASKILVNGSKVDLFVSEGLPLVKQHISRFCTDLSDLNQLFERTLQTCNSMKANQTTDKTNIMPVENGTDCEPTLEQSLFFCPTCEEVADQQTICCESCDSWYHYGCAGITVNDVSKISPEVPFICENCNEGLIYGDCQVEKENQSQDHKQNSILNSPQTGNCVTPQQESEVNVQVLASEPLQDNTMKSSGTASGANDTCNLNTPIVKNNKRKGDKTNTGAAKSKRNRNSDHDQTNVHQAQYIQRLELKIKNYRVVCRS